jgi:twitching motility protein PilT
MNQSLFDLYQKRVISYDEALGRSPVPDEFLTMVSRAPGEAPGQPVRKK